MRTTAATFIATVFACFALAALVHLIPRLGIPLHSDVTWIFRLQVSALDPGAIPIGLRALSGVPADPWTSCVTYYDAFGRWNCLDQLVMRTIALFAREDADRWRAAFVLLGSISTALFVVLCRQLRIAPLITALLALGVLLAPIEIWAEYTASETKGLPLLLGALVLASSSVSARAQWAAAAFTVAAVLAKETFLAAAPAVAGAALYGTRALELRDRRALFRAVVPQVTAVAVVGLVVIALRVRAPAGDYAFFIEGPHPPAAEWLRTYLSALQPAALRGLPLALLAGLAGIAVAAHARDAAFRRAVIAEITPGRLAFATGLLLAVVAHGAAYYATKRYVAESRYVVPANLEAALALGLGLTALARALGAGRALTIAGLTIAAGLAVRSWTRDLFWIALPMAIAASAAPLLRRRTATALLAALLVPSALPLADTALADAGASRVDQTEWAALVTRIRDAPPGSHVTLRFADPNMIELAWGLEAATLLGGRTDLIYHLELTGLAERGLLRSAADAMNRDRAAIGPGDPVLLVDADRQGHAGTRPPPPSGIAGAWRLLSDPQGFASPRYLEWRAPFLRWSATLERGR